MIQLSFFFYLKDFISKMIGYFADSKDSTHNPYYKKIKVCS